MADAGLQDVAHDDFINLCRRNARSLQGFSNGNRAELGRWHLTESAEIFADRCPRCGHDEGIGHQCLLLLGDGEGLANINYKLVPPPNNASY